MLCGTWTGGELGENGYMYMYSWVLSLFTWNCHNIVNLKNKIICIQIMSSVNKDSFNFFFQKQSYWNFQSVTKERLLSDCFYVVCQIFGRKHRRKSLWVWGRQTFPRTKKALAIKDKLNKLDFLKIKHFALQKKSTIKKFKWNAQSWGKYSQTINLLKELYLEVLGIPSWLCDKESACQCRMMQET